MPDLLRLLRRLRCTSVSPASLFSHRLRIGIAVAALILLVSILR
jgi:hypothetical protein